MSAIQSMFKEAFRLWHEKSSDEPPKHGSLTYDHFEKLRKEIETQSIKLGFGGLKSKAGVGIGCWAEIPWIGLRNPYLTDNFEEGEYIVYLLSPDYDTLYLGIIQGITRLTPEELAERTPRLRKEINKPEGFVVGIEGHLSRTSPFNSKPDKYERGLLYSKRYNIHAPLNEESFLIDLKAALNSYREYINKSL